MEMTSAEPHRHYVIRVLDRSIEGGEITTHSSYDFPFTQIGLDAAERQRDRLRPSRMASAGNPAQDASRAIVVDTRTGLAVVRDDRTLYDPITDWRLGDDAWRLEMATADDICAGRMFLVQRASLLETPPAMAPWPGGAPVGRIRQDG